MVLSTTYLLPKQVVFGNKLVHLVLHGLELILSLDSEPESTLAVLQKSIKTDPFGENCILRQLCCEYLEGK